MIRIVLSFALGVFVTSIAFLWWGGWPDGETLTHQSVSPDGETMIREGGDVALEPGWNSADGVDLDPDRQDSSAATAATQPAATDPDTDLDTRSQEGAPITGSAAEMRTTPAEIEELAVFSATLNRHIAFEDEARTRDPTSTSLEGILVNEAWSTVPTASSPIALNTECRVSVCRVRFEFGTDEGLRVAARSAVGVRMMDAVEQYGFEAVAMLINPDDPSRTLDVYLWREQESTP